MDGGGLNDLAIDRLNGRLVPPSSAHITAAELLADKPLRRKLGKLARETALAFGISRWQARWVAVLDAQLAGREL